MKKIIYTLLPLLLVFGFVSCNKEIIETPENNISVNIDEYTGEADLFGTRPITIEAIINDISTKGAYDDAGIYSWNKDNVFRVLGHYNSTKTISYCSFTALASGHSVSFTGGLANDWTPIYAIYPYDSFIYTDTDHAITASIPSQYSIENSLSNTPLVGTRNTDTNYSFDSAVGFLKVTIKGIPKGDNDNDTAGYVGLEYETEGDDYMLSGKFEVNEVNHTLSTYSSDGHKYQYISFTPEQDGETRTFFFKVPVKTLPAGLKVVMVDKAGEYYLYQSTTTRKAINVEKNTIIEFPVISASNAGWKYLGVGKFVDNYVFGLNGISKAGYYVDVEIYQSMSDARKFKVNNLYGEAWKKFGVTTNTTPSNAEFVVRNAGEQIYNATLTADGLVSFYREGNIDQDIQTGYSSYRVFHPFWANKTDDAAYKHNKVVSYQSNGLPEVIQLAYGIDTGYNSTRTWRDSYDGIAYLVFPGVNPGKSLVGTYTIAGSSAFTMTIDPSDDENYDCMITNYTNTNTSLSINGKAYCLFDAETGTLTVPAGQKFAQSGNTYYRFFMGGNSKNDLVFTFAQQNTTGSMQCASWYLGYVSDDQYSTGAYTGSGQQFTNGTPMITRVH